MDPTLLRQTSTSRITSMLLRAQVRAPGPRHRGLSRLRRRSTDAISNLTASFHPSPAQLHQNVLASVCNWASSCLDLWSRHDMCFYIVYFSLNVRIFLLRLYKRHHLCSHNCMRRTRYRCLCFRCQGGGKLAALPLSAVVRAERTVFGVRRRA